MSLIFWLAFAALVVGCLALDLGVFNRKQHVVSAKEAAFTSVIWVAIAAVFGLLVTVFKGGQAGSEYFTAYILEKSLSVDNLTVFTMIFSYFAVKPEHRHRVLFWGVIGAIVMRAILLSVGSGLIALFHPLLYVCGAFLLYTAYKMYTSGGDDDEVDPSKNFVVRTFKKYFPVTETESGGHFFVPVEDKVREESKTSSPGFLDVSSVEVSRVRICATSLFLALLSVEVMDLVFAVDSIPTVLAVSRDPFVLITSNVMAILGLRSLFFILDAVITKLRFLKAGVSLVLGFVGLKLLISGFVHIPQFAGLVVVFLVLGGAIAASCIWPEKESA